MRLWHGTAAADAGGLLGGADLEVEIAEMHQLDQRSLVGFYLAEVEEDAIHFAAVRNGVVLAVDLDEPALAALTLAGAIWQDIQRGPWPPLFAGRELYLPPGSLGVFNRLRREGLIRVAVA